MAIVAIHPIALEQDDAAEYVALSVSTLEKLVREGTFPKPRQLSPRRVAYLVRELDAWAEARPVSTILPPDDSGYGRAGKTLDANVSK